MHCLLFSFKNPRIIQLQCLKFDNYINKKYLYLFIIIISTILTFNIFIKSTMKIKYTDYVMDIFLLLARTVQVKYAGLLFRELTARPTRRWYAAAPQGASAKNTSDQGPRRVYI